MAEYLKFFKNENEYNEFIDETSEKDKPNLSHIIADAKIKEKIPYENQYLTFEVIEGGKVVWSVVNNLAAKTIQYSLDDGMTWESITSSRDNPFFEVNAGDKILFKGTNSNYATYPRTNKFYGSTIKYNIYGNIMSLFYGDDFIGKEEFPSTSSTITDIFRQTNVVEAHNLILPAKTMTPFCYSGMFLNCKQLISAPKLPSRIMAEKCYAAMFDECELLETAPELLAVTLADYCYLNMFNGCTSLNYIKMTAKDTARGSGSLMDWVDGVSSSGTFVKDRYAEIGIGTSGIPQGWTVVNV